MSDSDSCSESSRSESMSESELAVGGKMLGLGDDKMVGKPKKQRRDDNEPLLLVPNAVFDEEDEDPSAVIDEEDEVQLEGEGTYECSATGLVFEVSEQALVRYSVLTWSEFSEFLEDSWKPAGSIYDVDVEDPSVLKLIHFPHSLCLDESEHELSFRVLHVKGSHADIEPTVDYTASHVKWRVSSLSKVGPIIPRPQHVKHDGAVLLYKDQDHQEQFCLHVILALNNHSEFKAIEEQVRSSAEQSTGQKKKSRLEVMPSNIPLLPGSSTLNVQSHTPNRGEALPHEAAYMPLFHCRVRNGSDRKAMVNGTLTLPDHKANAYTCRTS
ncbi:unnamed protein product [Boreogadus saida]